MQADRSRLEHVAIVEPHNGHASEWLARPVLRAAALLPVHDGQLVSLAELLEQPQNPSRSPRMLSVEHVQHQTDDIRPAASPRQARAESRLIADAQSRSPHAPEHQATASLTDRARLGREV